jgi:protein tyrosine/serine phosphatase
MDGPSDKLADETPLIVHCTGGKDRTGVGSALILTALGVPRDTIVTDYAMTHTLFVRRQAQTERGHARQASTAGGRGAGGVRSTLYRGGSDAYRQTARATHKWFPPRISPMF